jgi:hypothetical protein
MSASEESLSDILAGKDPAPVQAPEPAKGEKEAAPPAAKESKPVEESAEAKAARDEKGRFAKAEEKPAEKQEKPRADVAAIIDERRKRQAAEQRLAELMQQHKPAEKPSVFENEDRAIGSRVDEGVAPLREMLYKMSLKTARAVYKDFGDAEQAFSEAMEKDERLLQGLRASDDPGEYIYTMGIHVRELADVGGDLMKYRDKITGSMKTEIETRDARIKALEAELATAKEAQTDLDSVPRSLNNTSSGSAPKPGSADPENLRNIVRFGNPKN